MRLTYEPKSFGDAMLETYEIKSLERNAIFQIKIAFFLVVRKA